jgi:N-methylhydantoinase B
LISDPYAEPLVRAVGVDVFTRLATGELDPSAFDIDDDKNAGMDRMVDNMAVRTKFFDDFFLDATAAGIDQAVILASGLDARAYRLQWPAGTVVYEVDQPQVVAFKTKALADIGGLVPGTNSGQAREIFHEGLLVPPVRLYRGFELIEEVEAILRANSRTPRLVVGDLHGQVGAARLATDRVRALCGKYGADTIRCASDGLLEQTERRVRTAIAGWPDGRYFGSRTLHTEGIESGKPVVIRVEVAIDGDRIRFDFSDSDDQVAGPYNIRPPLVRAVCYYALKCLVDPDIPSNGGLAAAVDATFRPGSLLSPEAPAPVNTYMTVAVATADALFDALGDALPAARIAESSKGTNGTLSYPVGRQGQPQVQYELPAGAIGARNDKDGVSASKAHVANGTLTPLEVVESEFPVEVDRFELTPDSGGAGRYRGGLGYVRDYRLLGAARFSSRTGKDLTPPAGRAGGLAGGGSSIVVNPGSPDGFEVTVDRGPVALKVGDVLRIAQAGGGGYGDPLLRPVDDVVADVREGYVSLAAAREAYGVVLRHADGGWDVDAEETDRLRGRGP